MRSRDILRFSCRPGLLLCEGGMEEGAGAPRAEIGLAFILFLLATCARVILWGSIG